MMWCESLDMAVAILSRCRQAPVRRVHAFGYATLSPRLFLMVIVQTI